MSLNDLLIKSAGDLPEKDKIAAIERNRKREELASKREELESRRQPITASQRAAIQRHLISKGLGAEELDGLKYLEDDEYARAFGQDQTDLNTYGDDEREAVDRLLSRRREDLLDLQERSNRLEKQGKKLSAGEKETINELLELLAVDDADPQVRPDIAPKNALIDAMTRLEQASQYGFDAFPGAADTLGRLEDDIRPNREAESSLVRELKARDDKQFSETRKLYNVVKNSIEADQISRDRYVGSGPAAFSEENLGRIGEVRSMGAAGSLGPMEMSQVIRFGNRSGMLDAEPIIDPAGKVVGYADPKTKVPIALDPAAEISAATQGANTPNTAQALNAPASPQTAQQWAASNLPEMVQNGGSTPPRYPQANITRETTDFASRLRGFGERIDSPALSGVSGNIRSLDELQKTADLVSREVGRRGQSLFVLDPTTGRNVPAGSQTVSGVMQKLGMSSGDEQRLANALFQLDAARRSSVNQNATGTYLARQTPPRPAEASDIVFDAPKEGFGSIPIAQIKNSSIRARFKGLDSKDAQKPFEAKPAQRPSSALSSFQQDPVYNKTRETSDDAIRAVLEDRASKRRAPKNESPADKAIRLARDESNIKAAQSVQRRAVEDAVRRSQIDAVRRQYMPPFMRR